MLIATPPEDTRNWADADKVVPNAVPPEETVSRPPPPDVSLPTREVEIDVPPESNRLPPNLGYTGRDHNVVEKAARDPKATFALSAFPFAAESDLSQYQLTVILRGFAFSAFGAFVFARRLWKTPCREHREGVRWKGRCGHE